MIRSSLAVVFLLAFLAPAHADVSVGISCEQFVVDGGSVEEVCAEHHTIGSSSDTVENIGSTLGADYIMADTYNILELDNNMTAEEMESMPGNYTKFLTGLVVQVKQLSSSEGCEVTINGTACTNCEVCADNMTSSVSVDCSSVPGGRYVQCEPLENVFFPFKGYALATDDADADGGDGDGDGLFPIFGSASSHRSYMAVVVTALVATVGTILQF